MDDSSLVLVSGASDGSRKRKRTMSKRERAKKMRYMNHMPNAEDFEVKCKHLKTALQCHEVSTEDVKRVREFVYRQPVKTIIDNKIAHLIEVKHPKWKKSGETLTNKGQAIRMDYFLRNINSERLLVCQKTFLAALKISQRNILTIGKKKAEGKIIERRGGDRRSKKYEEQKNSVKKFIWNLHASESHYNRIPQRMYVVYVPVLKIQLDPQRMQL
ncbi:unnamed protein product [Acanthoscelides obtectus]|uniref:Uncharacterized protein n=1 Tax=Acanthoscelides obtectus TaxID=200917 RepID=A0A9P0LUI6_ACAOB|nr:unnamed protein product [Acanthoscelides obtectus]CAK1660628.1 hypothetical protein AOBTE_LOCUS22192 [Acanthoscelides obtectus]